MNRTASIPYKSQLLVCMAFGIVTALVGAPLDAWARTTAIAVIAAPTTTPAMGAFDYSPITSLKANPTITGTAAFVSAPLLFTVLDSKGVVAYQNNSFVVDGHFTESIYPPIANGVYKLSIASGGKELATTTLVVGLHTALNIEPDFSLSPFDVADGHLMRFKVTAKGTGGVGVGQFTFSVVPGSVDVADMQLFGYTDSAFTNSFTEDGAALSSTTANFEPGSPVITIVPDETVEIPAGKTYYFDLIGTVTPSDTVYDVDTTLLGDTNPHISVFAEAASSSNFVWSPNTYGTSTPTALDWINGSIVAGIPKNGLDQVRTNAPPSGEPSCTLTASTSTAPVGTPLILTWSSDFTTSAVWETGLKADTSGSKTYTMGSSTHTYILNVSGPTGMGNCFATVATPYVPPIVATSTVTTTPTDGFTATPVLGAIPFTVTFTGSVNNSKTCTAQTFTLGYGDGTASTTITVAANLCKAVAFTYTHSYTKVATSTAGLYRSTGTTTAQRIQTQVIVGKVKLSILDGGGAMFANALSAVGGSVLDVWSWFISLFTHTR